MRGGERKEVRARMGLEWHDRHRDRYGRFTANNPSAPIQIHIRITQAQAEKLRAAALEAQQSLRSYCTAAILARMTAEGQIIEAGQT